MQKGLIEFSYNSIEHNRKIIIFANRICDGFMGLSVRHITMLIDTDVVYILFEISMGFFNSVK